MKETTPNRSAFFLFQFNHQFRFATSIRCDNLCDRNSDWANFLELKIGCLLLAIVRLLVGLATSISENTATGTTHL